MSADDILGEQALPGLQKVTFCVLSEAENSTLMTPLKTKHHHMRSQASTQEFGGGDSMKVAK